MVAARTATIDRPANRRSRQGRRQQDGAQDQNGVADQPALEAGTGQPCESADDDGLDQESERLVNQPTDDER